MNKEFTLKMVIQAVDQATAPVRKIGQAFADIVRRANLERLAAAVQRVRDKLATVARAAADAGKSMRDIGTSALTRITAPLGLLGGFAIKSAASLETLEVAFESMLGGADAAKTMVKDLAGFAAKTPFQLEGIGAAARQLLSFGVGSGEVMGTLKFLGDIAAGANVPLENMASIFGKAKAKGKAMTEELLQLSEQGVPIIDVLAKKLGRSKSEVFELASAGRISFATFASALQSMSAEGGIFFDQMNKQSGTLAGLFSSLMDGLTNAFAEVGKQIVETFNLKENMASLIAFIDGLAEGFRNFAKENPGLAKTAIILAAVAAAAGPLLIALGGMVTVFGFMATGLGALLSPIGLVVMAIAALAAGAFLIYDNWAGIAAFFKGLWDSVAAAFEQGFLQGVVNLLETFNPVIWIAKGVNALISFLTGVDLFAVGSEWIGGLADGMKERFTALQAWLTEAIGELTSWLPDWVKDKLGIEGLKGGSNPNPAAGGASGLVGSVPSALGPMQSQVGGSITVGFDNAPANMQIREVKSDTPGFGIDVDAGYAMGMP